MSANSTVFFRKEGLLVPQGLFTRLAKTFTGRYAALLPIAEKELVLPVSTVKPPSIESFKEMMEKKKFPFAIQMIDQDVKVEHAPPYHLITDGQTVKLSCLLVGDWSKAYPPDEGAPPWQGFVKKLQSKVKLNAKPYAGDHAKFFDAYFADDDAMNDLMEGCVGEHAMIVAHCDGGITVVSNTSSALKAEWGWVSDPLDYKEPGSDKTDDDQPDDGGLAALEALLSGGETEKPKLPDGVHEVKETKGNPNKDKKILTMPDPAKKADTAEKISGGTAVKEEYVYVTVQEGLNAKQKRELMVLVLGNADALPTNYKDAKQFKAPLKKVEAINKMMKERGSVPLKTSPYKEFSEGAGNGDDAGKKGAVEKETERKEAPAGSPSPDTGGAGSDDQDPAKRLADLRKAKTAATSALALSVAEEKEIVEAVFKIPEVVKILEGSGEELKLEELKAIEENYPRGFKRLGADSIDVYLQMRPDHLEQLMLSRPKFGFLIILDLLIEMHKANRIEQKAKDKVAM